MSRVGIALLLAAGSAFAAQASAATPGGVHNTYAVYGLGIKGGEPSIGWDPGTHSAFYAAGTKVLRLTFGSIAAGHGRPNLVKADVTPPFSPATLDTILVTDQLTHRTYVSYLAGACSILAFTNGGQQWSQSQGCGIGTFLDHQSVGVGPFHAPFTANPVARDAVYYCAQNSFNASCAVSLDGGQTFGPGVPAYNTPANKVGDPLGGACSALHGHLRVGPDGTAYLPLKGCGGVPTVANLTNTEYAGGHPSVSVSEDNGATWTVRTQGAGHNGDESDPSVGIGAKGSVYLGWEEKTNVNDTIGGSTSKAAISVSHDHGRTWSRPYDAGRAVGVNNVMFPEVIAGDDNRAAYSFLGTKGVGDDQQNGFVGEWHAYVATTYDGGQSWTTVDATPGDPVQRGCIDLQGLAPGSPKHNVCSNRNQLDFNDITVDDAGRALVAITDACVADCKTDPSVKASGRDLTVIRQTTGRGLYAAFDGRMF